MSSCLLSDYKAIILGQPVGGYEICSDGQVRKKAAKIDYSGSLAGT